MTPIIIKAAVRLLRSTRLCLDLEALMPCKGPFQTLITTLLTRRPRSAAGTSPHGAGVEPGHSVPGD